MILRSLIFIVFFTLPLFSQSIFFKDFYCIKKRFVYSKDLFPDFDKNFLLFTIPRHLTFYKVPLLKLKKIFEKNGYKIDQKNRVITFSLDCKEKNDFLSIKERVKKIYKNRYPTISVKRVILRSFSHKNFDENEIEKIEIAPSSLKRYKGFVKVYLKNGKRVVFSYEIDAFLDVLKAVNDIKKDTVLTPFLFSREKVKFRYFYAEPVTKNHFFKTKAVRFIKEGEILTKNMIKRKGAVQKGDILRAFLREEGITLSFDVISLQDGAKGEIIRVKQENGKIFKAQVISNKIVEIK